MRKYSKQFIALTAFPATLASASAPPVSDPDSQAWWKITASLSSDAMEGRDTGSAGYERAAHVVAAKFKAAGLTPLGEKGGWLQAVAMNEINVSRADVSIGGRPLKFLYDFTVSPAPAMPKQVDALLAYRGYCDAAKLGDVKGKLVICHGAIRAGLPTAAQRDASVKAAGGIGIITIADPGFTVEPPRWPFAYARDVSLANTTPNTEMFLRMRLNADALETMIGRSHDAAELIAKGSSGQPLPNFDPSDAVRARFTITRRAITSPNVIGFLPGTDPTLADQAIVLSAHLDGYGFGAPVNGDRLYNGTLDDAAYVALLIRLAERRHGKGFRRPVIFAAWTGEEKGLLGSIAFLQAPTFPKSRIAANINLDQLRPIFPLDLLTVHALDDSSLGDDTRAIAAAMGISVQRDPEPERNLLRRSDQWTFMTAGIPATAFVFGYSRGSESERIYRQWYKTGYHKPQDDLDQLMDWKAAADFNRFFYTLVGRVADQDKAPSWKAGSKLNPSDQP